jgi:asparagine synthetase B (glutamine-hydrolysing)
MPGLVGVVGNKTINAAEIAKKMALRLGLGGIGDSIRIKSAAGVAMASDSRPLNLWGDLVAYDDDGNILGINGEVFGLFDEKGKASHNFMRGAISNPAKELLALYRQYGMSMVPRLRGFFSISIWDNRWQTLHLITDRFALRSLYYSALGDTIVFGSEVKTILASGLGSFDMDEHGMADFLLLGMPSGNRTFFKDVLLAPPGSIISFKNGECKIEKYWNLHFEVDASYYGKLERAVEEFSEVFEEALSDCVSDQGIFDLPLSGGLDSRCIGVAAMGGTALRSYTMGGYDSMDLEIGPVVAKRLEIPNSICSLTSRDFIDWIESSVYITDGMYSSIHASIMPIIRRLPDDAKVVLDGANSFDGYYKVIELFHKHSTNKREKALECSLRICPQPIIDKNMRMENNVFNEPFLRAAKHYIISSLDEYVESIPENQKGNQFDTIDYLDLSNRLRRFNMMGAVLIRSKYEVRHPFLDHRVVDFVTKLPYIYRTKEKILMGRYIGKKDRYLGSLVYERTGIPANSNAVKHIMKYAARYYNKIKGRMGLSNTERPRVAIDYMYWIRNDKALQKYIKTILLEDNSLKRYYLEKKAVEPYIQELINGNSKNLSLVFRLISMELSYRFFLEGGTPSTY